MIDVTHILNAIEQGDGKAADKLLPLVYEGLRILTAQKLSKEQPGQTLPLKDSSRERMRLDCYGLMTTGNGGR